MAMELNRRQFFRVSGSLALAGRTDEWGCLVDTTLCVGCRKCEQACNQRHRLPDPAESFEEMTVLENERRMDETSYTVVNKYYPKNIGTLTWRQRPDLCQVSVHALQRSVLRVGLHRGRPDQGAQWAVVYDAKNASAAATAWWPALSRCRPMNTTMP
jgi:ferredoxin